MTRTKVTERLVPHPKLVEVMRVQVKKHGGQTAVGKEIGKDQGTVSRAIDKKEPSGSYETYAAMARLFEMWEPFYAMQSPEHLELAKLADELAQKDPVAFADLLRQARKEWTLANGGKATEGQVKALKSSIVHPLPPSHRK